MPGGSRLDASHGQAAEGVPGMQAGEGTKGATRKEGADVTEPETTTAQAVELDRFRVEIKESASGKVQVSTRATHQDSDEAVRIAVQMYHEAVSQVSGG